MPLKAVDPFCRGSRRKAFEKKSNETHSKPKVVQHNKAIRLRKMRRAFKAQREQRAQDEAAAESATKHKKQYDETLRGLSRDERKKALSRPAQPKKRERVVVRPVLTTNLRKSVYDEYTPMMTGVDGSGQQLRGKKQKVRRAAGDVAPIDIGKLVEKKLSEAMSKADLQKNMALQNELSKEHRSRSKLLKLVDKAESNPYGFMADESGKQTSYVDSTQLTRDMLKKVQLKRGAQERYFDFRKRVRDEARDVVRNTRIDKQGQQRASKSKVRNDKRRERKRLKAQRKKRLLAMAMEDATIAEHVPFGVVAERPPDLPSLPQRVLKHKHPRKKPVFTMPTEKQAQAALAAGMPIIESTAGGRAATRAAITNSKVNTDLVGAASLSVEEYAASVRAAYKKVKAQRRANGM